MVRSRGSVLKNKLIGLHMLVFAESKGKGQDRTSLNNIRIGERLLAPKLLVALMVFSFLAFSLAFSLALSLASHP